MIETYNQESFDKRAFKVNADLAEPSLRFGWRTAAVIPELDDEIDTYNAPGFKNLVQRLNHIEFEYDLLASKENYSQGSEIFNSKHRIYYKCSYKIKSTRK